MFSCGARSTQQCPQASSENSHSSLQGVEAVARSAGNSKALPGTPPARDKQTLPSVCAWLQNRHRQLQQVLSATLIRSNFVVGLADQVENFVLNSGGEDSWRAMSPLWPGAEHVGGFEPAVQKYWRCDSAQATKRSVFPFKSKDCRAEWKQWVTLVRSSIFQPQHGEACCAGHAGTCARF